MRAIALDSFDNRREGDEFECSERQFEQLEKKGLVKKGPKVENKMAPASLNKENPTVAAGAMLQSSVSPADQASLWQTAERYPGGGLVQPDPRFSETETPCEKSAETSDYGASSL